MEHTFAGNPLLAGKRDHLTSDLLAQLVAQASIKGKGGILPFLEGKALVACRDTKRQQELRVSVQSSLKSPSWELAWQPFQKFKLTSAVGTQSSAEISQGSENADISQEANREGLIVSSLDRLIYIGELNESPFFAVDVAALHSGGSDSSSSLLGEFEVPKEGGTLGWVDARTLMTASDWGDEQEMKILATVGHARALLEWHKQVQFCGRCGAPTLAIEAGQRRQCTTSTCKTKAYPRTDPVVIMLVIDRERDRVLLGRQSRFVPRMWSCLAGFLEPGESLEEAVRRETREESGVEVGEIVYHSSQPWPVGGGSMSCQLMIGFFAFATTFDIHVDKQELEDARWHSRAQVREGLQNLQYKSLQLSSRDRIANACSPTNAPPVSSDRSKPKSSVDKREEQSAREPQQDAGNQQSMPFFPGPYAIAHHLISTWAEKGPQGILSKV